MIETPGTVNGKYRIAIGVPSHDHCPSTFAFDLARMIGYSVSTIGDKFDFGLYHVQGTYVHKARQQLITDALEDGAHYLLWIDSDMRFPKDALIKLLARDVPAVGINYCTRGIPPKFVAIKKMTQFSEDGKLIPGVGCMTHEDSTGLEEVDALGFGFFLMKMVVLRDFPEDQPWFFFEWSDKTGKLHVGEDVWFCRMLREKGWKIYIDHDLSKECAHTGSFEFKLEHAQDYLAMQALDRQEREKANGDLDVQRASDGDSELAEQERPDDSNS